MVSLVPVTAVTAGFWTQRFNGLKEVAYEPNHRHRHG